MVMAMRVRRVLGETAVNLVRSFAYNLHCGGNSTLTTLPSPRRNGSASRSRRRVWLSRCRKRLCLRRTSRGRRGVRLRSRCRWMTWWRMSVWGLSWVALGGQMGSCERSRREDDMGVIYRVSVALMKWRRRVSYVALSRILYVALLMCR